MLPFTSTDGLAGDAVVIGGIISWRQIEIASLQEQVTKLEKSREEQSKAIEEDIMRRIKDPEKLRKATTQERSKKIKELRIACLVRTGPIIERIDELQRLNDHDRSLIAPIRKLPAELLGYVFQHHIDLNASPWVLTLVTRGWRHTAMTTPSLWVNLLLYSVEHPRVRDKNEFELWRIDGRIWYSSGRRVVCHDPSELSAIISRAGSLPLDINLSYRNDNAPVVQAVLGDTAVACRVASLSIDGASPVRESSFHNVAGVTIGSFPLLHSLTISSVPEKLPDETLESISISSPHLKHLTAYQTIPLSLDFSFWPSLRSLHLSQASISETFNNLVPHLEELEILEVFPQFWPDDSTPEFTLAKLTTLKVFCSLGYLRKLRLPALLHLSIMELFRRARLETEGEPLISLPALEILDVDSGDFLSCGALLSTPCLRVFRLRQTGLRSLEVSLFQNIGLSTVQDFTLDYPCTDESAISALECLPNAEKVAVNSGYPLREELQGVEILQRIADAESMLCPHMTHFTLGSPSNRVVVNKTLAAAYARRAIENRMDGGVKMEHFEIHFKAREESIQYA